MKTAGTHIGREGPRMLVADIGGTNARFGLADPGLPQLLQADSVREYAIAGFASLDDAARCYLEEQQTRVQSAVLAIAGRVVGEEVRVTNHAWSISAAHLQRALDLRHVVLVNDFAAQAMAITRLQPQDVAGIGGGVLPAFEIDRARTYAVIGPGTGLGVGALLVRDGRCHPLETEGGHAGFAPATAGEMRTLEALVRRFGRVSCERLVSGPGLANLYAVACEMRGEPVQALEPSDITSRARSGDARCVEAIEMFCAAFGSMAGDLVLTHGAWDGVFLAGGLVPKLLDALQASSFRARFENKGRFSAQLAHVPSFAVLHPHAGLLGAAAYAAQAEWRRVAEPA